MLAAVEKGDAKELAKLMRQNPGFNMNMDLDGNRWTLLHYACRDRRRSAVIPLLLAHPVINVNLKDKSGHTPFYWACCRSPSCAREMLKDSRVKVNEPTNGGSTPLCYAAGDGSLDVIRWWIASGREMDLGTRGDVDKTDAIGRAKMWGNSEAVTLLERFQSDATKTRHAVRVELGWYDKLAAEMFALVVSVSDGLLQIKDTTTPSPAARYFSIATRLPLEL